MDKETKLLFKKAIGERIREKRIKQMMTIAELAEYAMVDEKNLGRIERGERLPELNILIKVTRVLNIGLDEVTKKAKDFLETMPEEEIKQLHQARLANRRGRKKRR